MKKARKTLLGIRSLFEKRLKETISKTAYVGCAGSREDVIIKAMDGLAGFDYEIDVINFNIRFKSGHYGIDYKPDFTVEVEEYLPKDIDDISLVALSELKKLVTPGPNNGMEINSLIINNEVLLGDVKAEGDSFIYLEVDSNTKVEPRLAVLNLFFLSGGKRYRYKHKTTLN